MSDGEEESGKDKNHGEAYKAVPEMCAPGCCAPTQGLGGGAAEAVLRIMVPPPALDFRNLKTGGSARVSNLLCLLHFISIGS